MLVNPSIDDLLLKIDNKFKLVTLAMKRARQINEGDPDIRGQYNSAKPISKALQEIYDGEVYVRQPNENDTLSGAMDDLTLNTDTLTPDMDLAINLGADTDKVNELLTGISLTDTEL